MGRFWKPSATIFRDYVLHLWCWSSEAYKMKFANDVKAIEIQNCFWRKAMIFSEKRDAKL